MKTIQAVDLFCGAGGTSAGLYAAADILGLNVNLLAVNHWNVAIATHSANHKEAVHKCETLDNVNPRKVIPGGRLDLLVASPECTHHSNARGGRPMNDQSRASAWHICRWAEALYIKNIIIENVREFKEWGPLGANGKPIKSQKGETFQAFLQALRALGYNVDHTILNAANYGDPTTRERLFVIARRRAPVRWPRPSHSPAGKRSLSWKTKPWRAAREIIDWTLPGKSIFNRKKSLSPNTVARILAGLEKFGGPELQPFLVMMYGTNDARSVDRPCPTVTGGGGHIGLAQPFMLGQQSGATPRTTEEPVPTIATAGAISLVQPFILPKEGVHGGNRSRSIEEPLQTVVPHHGGGYLVQPFLVGAGGPSGSGRPKSTEEPMDTVLTENHKALVQPFLVEFHGDKEGKKRVRSVDEPVPTLATAKHLGLTEPFIVPFFGERKGQKPRTHSVKEPLPAVTSHGAGGLVEPVLVPTNHGKADKRTHSVDKPMPTVTAFDAMGLADAVIVSAGGPKVAPRSVDEPLNTVLTRDHMGVAGAHIVKYYGTGDGVKSVDEPLDTICGRDKFALVQPVINGMALDIRFRMLQPHELSAAMSFPKNYKFKGNREQQVKQIGNAVPVGLATALCMAVLIGAMPNQSPKEPKHG